MTEIETLEVPIRECLQFKLKVSGLKLFTLRCKLAAMIFNFGGWVAGVPVEIEFLDKS